MEPLQASAAARPRAPAKRKHRRSASVRVALPRLKYIKALDLHSAIHQALKNELGEEEAA